MPTRHEYRNMALDCLLAASQAWQANVRNELIRLAMTYIRLAELAEHNAMTDLVYETPPDSRTVRQRSGAA